MTLFLSLYLIFPCYLNILLYSRVPIERLRSRRAILNLLRFKYLQFLYQHKVLSLHLHVIGEELLSGDVIGAVGEVSEGLRRALVDGRLQVLNPVTMLFVVLFL